MHGAFLTGLREAANMAQFAKARTMRKKIVRSPSNNAHSCALLLMDLFREPDLEFGSFSVTFGRKNTDPKSPAILRVSFSEPRKKNQEGSKTDQQHSNKDSRVFVNSSTPLALKSGTLKLKPGALKQKFIRRAKIVRNTKGLIPPPITNAVNGSISEEIKAINQAPPDSASSGMSEGQNQGEMLKQ